MNEPTEPGVMLPDIDPAIGELVLSTLRANPHAHVSEIAVGLIKQCPDLAVAIELMSALMEIVLCREKGHLYWLDVTGHSCLIGARRVLGRDALTFGHNVWPIAALMASTPKSVTIGVGDTRVRVWLATTLEGAVIRQSEAIALGNVIVEGFGGRIIEDRHGPETMHEAFVEQRMTERSRKRGEALSAVSRLTADLNANPTLRADHARVAVAEAAPGSCTPGMRFHPEEHPQVVYTMESRVNDSWIVLVAELPGPGSNAEPCAWLRDDGLPPAIGRDWRADMALPPHWGFSDEPAIAPRPVMRVVIPPPPDVAPRVQTEEP